MADTAIPSPDPARFETITLSKSITRGEQIIETITLRKPSAGNLRGMNLQQLIACDVTAILQLLPRISDPVLVEAECNDLDPSDLTEIGGAIRGFFMTASERRMLEAMIAEQQPKT